MEGAVGDKKESWAGLEIGTCAWAAAKMKDSTMSPEERAYVERIHLRCLTPKGQGGDAPTRRM